MKVSLKTLPFCIKKNLLSDLKILPPKKSAFTIETPDYLPKQHTLCCWSGKRGSGKSVACANFVAVCKKLGVYDKYDDSKILNTICILHFPKPKYG